MPSPNLMVELSVEDVTRMITALSFHVGEVQRNPYHLLVPPWMQDNVRRGGELVGGQGGAAPDFSFATLYRVRRWASGELQPVWRWRPDCDRCHERSAGAGSVVSSRSLESLNPHVVRRTATRRPRMSEAVIACDAVLFDMDGTLVDSRELVERMWLQWAAEHGLSADAVLAVAHGRRTLETMAIVAPHLATPEEAARLDALEASEESNQAAIAGAKALLETLPADRWAVVTSAGHELALARLASVGLPRPLVLVGADDVAEGKPAPDGYLKAAAALGVRSRALRGARGHAGRRAGRPRCRRDGHRFAHHVRVGRTVRFPGRRPARGSGAASARRFAHGADRFSAALTVFLTVSSHQFPVTSSQSPVPVINVGWRDSA